MHYQSDWNLHIEWVEVYDSREKLVKNSREKLLKQFLLDFLKQVSHFMEFLRPCTP